MNQQIRSKYVIVKKNNKYHIIDIYSEECSKTAEFYNRNGNLIEKDIKQKDEYNLGKIIFESDFAEHIAIRFAKLIKEDFENYDYWRW